MNRNSLFKDNMVMRQSLLFNGNPINPYTLRVCLYIIRLFILTDGNPYKWKGDLYIVSLFYFILQWESLHLERQSLYWLSPL